jgi:hypothetical protein
MLRYLSILYLTLLASNVTAVWAKAFPVITAPVCITIAVLLRMIPLKLEVVPSVATPATCQKIFLACAPPISITFLALDTLRPPAIWNIQTAFELPDKVTSCQV